MIRLLRGTLAHLVALGVLALVLLAILISAARLALPLLNQHSDQFATVLSERLGYPLRMGGMSLHLSGWSPRIALDHVVLADPGGGPDLLSLRALELDLDLPASLRLGSPQIRALTLVGARLALRRFADGRIRALGLGGLQSDDPRTLEPFLRQGRLNLEDSEVVLIDDRFPGGLPRLTQVQLRLTNQGQIHRLDLRARPVAGRPGDPDLGSPSDTRIQVLADLRGDGLDPSTWGGGVYLKLSGPGALGLVPAETLVPVLPSARAQGLVLDVWLKLGAGGVTEGLGRVALEGLHLTPDSPGLGPSTQAEEPGTNQSQPGLREIVVDRLSALARVAPTAAGWHIGVRDLSLALEGSELEGLDFDLRLSAGGRVEGLQLAVDTLDLALVAPLMRLNPWSLPWAARRLEDLGPEGHLKRVGLVLEHPLEGAPRWRLAAIGNGVGIRQSDTLSGVEGLCLRLRADQDGGELRLRSEWLQVDLTSLFDRPIYLDRFRGLLAWTLGPTGALRLSGRNLLLENSDLGGRARFDLELPAPGGGTDAGPGPFLDLRARLEDGNGARVRTYLPVGVLKPRLVQWLERALAGGRVPQGDLILRGALGHFPFRGHQGRFELLLKVEDVGLRFHEDWPPIEAASGSIRLINQGMEVGVESGRILDSAIHWGRAAIPDLWGPRRLGVHGEVEGPLSDGLRILVETPLAARLGPHARALEVAGTARLTLDLDLPLGKGEPLGLDGRLSWPGPAQVAIKGSPLTLTDLTGELRFTNRTLTAESIGARLWGQPLTLAVVTRESVVPGDRVTEVLARSRMPLKDLARHLPSPVWSVAQGDLAWDLGVELPTADPRLGEVPLRWHLASDLRGVTLDLPPPLGKTANQARPLELEGALLPGRSLGVQGDLGELGLDLLVDLTEGPPRLERGRVALGAKAPAGEVPAPIPDGLRVEGDLSELDLPRWGAWWSRVRIGQNGQGSWGDWALITGPGPVTLDLSIARLDLGAMALTDARVRSAMGGPGRTLELDSHELSGELDLPAPGSKVPLGLHLARLDLACLMPPDGGRDPSPVPGARVDLSLIPPADLRVEDLRWGDEGLGRLTLDVRPEPSALRVPRIELQGPGGTRMRGDATWLDGSEGGRTRLALDLESADLGPLVRALDYKAVFSAAPIESSIRLEWPGGPGAFALARSSGTIDLKVGPGRLLEVEPGVGRVLGILNLGALGRRLSLDFRDLYEQGFSFEQILGDIQVGGGRAQLRRFEIEGPSSTIRVDGSTDLRARTFDQTVTVEPRIGSSVALASALAGGPLVGAAVYLADKVSGGSIDKLGSYRYRVTGPWADPELVRLGWDPFSLQGEPGTPATLGPALPSLPPVRPGESHFLD